MKIQNPVVLSILAICGLLPLLIGWEFFLEPKFADSGELDGERWETVIIGITCGILALIYPTFLAFRDFRARVFAERQLFDAIETIPEGFVVYDPNDRLVICNKRFRDFYGYSETEAAPGVTRTALGQLDAQRGVRIGESGGEEYVDLRQAVRTEAGGEQELLLPDGRCIQTRERVTVDGGLVSVQSDITNLRATQKALQHSEQQLVDAIEAIPDGFAVYDSEMRLVISNKRHRETYGLTDEQATPGTLRSDLIRLDMERGVGIDNQTGEDFLRARMDFIAALEREQELRMPDGRRVLTRQRPTSDGGIVTVQTDVTDLKNAQEALAQSEEHLRGALQNMSEAFVYFDADGRLVLCNDQYRKLYGYTEEETRPGMTRLALGNIDRERGIMGSREEAEEFLSRRGPQLREGGGQDEEFLLADGRWLLSRATRLDDGSVASIQSDVTELKRIQARAAESEQRLLDAIENLEEGFIFFDAEDKLIVANSRYKEMYPAQMGIQPGIKFEEAVRLSVDGGEVPVAVGRVDEWMARRLTQHHQLHRVDEQRLANGRWIKISERRTSEGGSVGVRTDITALKESQMAAEAANRAKSNFLAHMSHELRTPLNSIIGFSEILSQRIFGDLSDQYKEYADNIHGSGVHLLALITDILDISKIEAGEMKSMAEAMSVAAAVEDCAAMMRPRAFSKHINLMTDEIELARPLFVDPRHFKQILLNLISNAIKFTSAGGSITIGTNCDEKIGLRVSVADTGIGIAHEDQSHIFEPFSQVNNSETLAQDGTGLGLFLVKSLAELNGGKVSLTSQVSLGTTVTVTFPPDMLIEESAGSDKIN